MTGASAGMDRAQADYMGMLATVINSLALQDVLERLRPAEPACSQPSRWPRSLSPTSAAAHPASREGRVVIFGGGHRQPVLHHRHDGRLAGDRDRAGALLRGTHSGVEGIYDDDPRTNPNAKKLDTVGYVEIINRGLRAMDPTAVTLAWRTSCPSWCSISMSKGNVRSILLGEAIGTLVT